MPPVYVLRAVVEEERDRWEWCSLEVVKRARRSPVTANLVMPYGIDKGQTERRGAYITVTEEGGRDVGLMHVRGVPNSKHASVLVSASAHECRCVEPAGLTCQKSRSQDYFALWLPAKTEDEQRRVAPPILKALADSMTDGDFVIAAIASENRPLFRTAGFLLSYTLFDLYSDYGCLFVVGAHVTPPPELLKYVRGLDGRNPTFSKNLYSCTAHRRPADRPACLHWAPHLCHRCRKAAFCDVADLQEHLGGHEEDRTARAIRPFKPPRRI